MSPGTVSCPRCGGVIPEPVWKDASQGSCPGCQADVEVLAFPALTASRTVARASTAMLTEESVCFFHPSNRGEAICDQCGRILCLVCAIPFSGQRVCPECIGAAQSTGPASTSRDRVLYDRIALMVALIPLLLWPFTLLTAPVALGLTFWGWKKPGSLVSGISRTAQVAALVLSVSQITGWVVLFTYLAGKKHR
jgi:uncharacterized paraquat-inducible protein A